MSNEELQYAFFQKAIVDITVNSDCITESIDEALVRGIFKELYFLKRRTLR